MLSPSEHAAAIIAHYMRALTERSGLRWTDANDRDMATLAELLGAVETELQDSIPPFHDDMPPIVSDRVTQSFEREGNDGIPDRRFQEWRGQQRWSEDDDVRRLVRREEYRR